MNSSTVQRLEVFARAPQRAVGGLLHLLYHELTPEPAAYKYGLSTAAFEQHLQLFKHLRTTEHLIFKPEITFDDGHLSHYTQALPLLRRFGISARFFITAGWTSQRPDYMSWEQLRELSEAGQKLGAHGWSHKLLTHCSPSELHEELSSARNILEEKLGVPITTMSLPGGRANHQVLEACTRAGYTQVFTSIPRAEVSESAPLVGRLNLRSATTTAFLERLLTSPEGTLRRLERQHRFKEATQRALGDTLYAKLWALLNRAHTKSA